MSETKAPFKLTEAEREQSETWLWAVDVANESVAWWSRLHPDIRMSLDQWEDLKDAIIREAASLGNGAKDLLPGEDQKS